MALDTSAALEERQFAVYRAMSPERRVELAFEMSEAARRLALDGVRQRHPEYSERDVFMALMRMLHGDEMVQRAWPGEALRSA
jgi:hypothetical protein